MQLLEYLNNLDKKLEDKDLLSFWLLVDREDFKPIKMEDKKLKEYLKENKNYYANKRIAVLSIYVSNEQKKIDNKDCLVSIRITIFKISERGTLDMKGTLKINYYEEDLNKKKITLKEIQKFVKLCADDILLSGSFKGFSYTELLKKLKNKNIKF